MLFCHERRRYLQARLIVFPALDKSQKGQSAKESAAGIVPFIY